MSMTLRGPNVLSKRDLSTILDASAAGGFEVPGAWAIAVDAIEELDLCAHQASARAEGADAKIATDEAIASAIAGAQEGTVPPNLAVPIVKAQQAKEAAEIERRILLTAVGKVMLSLDARIKREGEAFMTGALRSAFADTLATAKRAAKVVASIDVTDPAAIGSATDKQRAAYLELVKASERIEAIRKVQDLLLRLTGRGFTAYSHAKRPGTYKGEDRVARLLFEINETDPWVPSRAEEQALIAEGWAPSSTISAPRAKVAVAQGG